MSRAFSSRTSTVAPDPSNCEIGPSSRVSAPCRVWGAPITSKTYGEVSWVPSISSPDGVACTALWATSRTLPLTCIASAPAERSSSIVSSTESTSTCCGPSVTVTRMPGPVTGTRPARMPSSSSCFCAAASAALWAWRLASSWRRVDSSRLISCCARWELPANPDRTSTRSCSRNPAYVLSVVLVRTWVIAANPRAASRTPTTAWARDGRNSASRSRCRPISPTSLSVPVSGAASGSSCWSSSSSGMEHVPPYLRHVGEDPDAEDDDDTGRQLTADAELVAEVDDRGRDHDIAHERDHEDLVVEDPLEIGAERAEDGVEGRDDGDRQVRVEAGRDVGGEDQPQDDPDEKSYGGDH